jgi:hypothetical protein
MNNVRPWKYVTIDDLVQCEECGKPVIDIAVLYDYSDDILESAISSIDECLKNQQGLLGYSFTSADEEAVENYYHNMDHERNHLEDAKNRMIDELQSRVLRDE